ncbi:hypothetical protein TNCV_2929261 [Trichonephila clavipes]|nr:hypothetical protein TNCV_2929261 [Trichonephila clavipes]
MKIDRGMVEELTGIVLTVQRYTERTPAHVFDCTVILAALQEIGSCFRQQTSMRIILNRLPEQSSGLMLESDLDPSRTHHYYHHHHQ